MLLTFYCRLYVHGCHEGNNRATSCGLDGCVCVKYFVYEEVGFNPANKGVRLEVPPKLKLRQLALEGSRIIHSSDQFVF